MADLQSPQKFFRQGLTRTYVSVIIEFITELIYHINIFEPISRYITDCGEKSVGGFLYLLFPFSYITKNPEAERRRK
jgi:hypothetical protein